MLKVEEATIFVALVSKSKVDAGAILGGGPNEVRHDLGDVEGQLALGLRRRVDEPAWGLEGVLPFSTRGRLLVSIISTSSSLCSC